MKKTRGKKSRATVTLSTTHAHTHSQPHSHFHALAHLHAHYHATDHSHVHASTHTQAHAYGCLVIVHDSTTLENKAYCSPG
jgi:hypothetical protein